MKVKLYILSVCLLICGRAALADAIYLKNGEEIKGIVVEDYQDRVVISTSDGEKTVLKREIGNIVYDAMEQNLVELGDKYLVRREYENAYFYYEKAHRTNPDYNIAREKMNHVMGYLFRKREEAKISDIKRKQEFETWPARVVEVVDSDKQLNELIGIKLLEKESRIIIDEIMKDSPAYLADLRKGDRLISVWGRFTGYMSEEEVSRILLAESFGEIKLVIERDIVLQKEAPTKNYRDTIGGRLDTLIEGLTVVDIKDGSPGQKAGLKKNDLIVGINGFSTRYMPINNAIKIIEDRNNDNITFAIRRDMTLWRKK